jgi:hypothetical protein
MDSDPKISQVLLEDEQHGYFKVDIGNPLCYKILTDNPLRVEANNGEVAGRSVVKCALRPKPKTSPITDNATLLQTLLDEQPDILTINRRYAFDDLKTILEKFLNPEDDIEDNVPLASNTVADSAEPSDLPWEKPEAKPYTLENVAPKATNTDKFDELF